LPTKPDQVAQRGGARPTTLAPACRACPDQLTRFFVITFILSTIKLTRFFMIKRRGFCLTKTSIGCQILETHKEPNKI